MSIEKKIEIPKNWGDYISPNYWKKSAARSYLLDIYEAKELYRVYFAPSTDAPVFWISVGKARQGKAFIEILFPTDKKQAREARFELSGRQFFWFKRKLQMQRCWSLCPTFRIGLESLEFYLEFLTDRKYRFVGFFSDPGPRREQYILDEFLKITVTAVNTETQDVEKQRFSAELLKKILPYAGWE